MPSSHTIDALHYIVVADKRYEAIEQKIEGGVQKIGELAQSAEHDLREFAYLAKGLILSEQILADEPARQRLMGAEKFNVARRRELHGWIVDVAREFLSLDQELRLECAATLGVNRSLDEGSFALNDDNAQTLRTKIEWLRKPETMALRLSHFVQYCRDNTDYELATSRSFGGDGDGVGQLAHRMKVFSDIVRLAKDGNVSVVQFLEAIANAKDAIKAQSSEEASRSTVDAKALAELLGEAAAFLTFRDGKKGLGSLAGF